jgi:putative SOS response-associated peptidase YedK
MCYSAQIRFAYRKYVRLFGAELSLGDFVELLYHRQTDPRIKLPKSLEADFVSEPPHSDTERTIVELIEAHKVAQARSLEQELFKQRKRLADAERTLQTKATRSAQESRRIASSKIDWARGKLDDLRRTEPNSEDARIFPGWYAPVLISEGGRLVVKPMRYQCRPAGKPAAHDGKFPGTYNARRDSLQGFWKGLFGTSHGILVANAFYENVERHRLEGRALRDGEAPGNVVLEFRPRPQQDMLVACLWSRWSAPGERDLLSFAAITDEPPAEVAAAGHDRCIIPIKPRHLEAWLNPAPGDLAAQQAILDDRERPFYEHRLAA